MFRSTKPSSISLQFPVRSLSTSRLLRLAPCALRDRIPPQSVKPTRNVANPFRIRTSAKRACNSFRIRTSKTRDLKPFRMNTYKKPPGGGGPYLVCLERFLQ